MSPAVLAFLLLALAAALAIIALVLSAGRRRAGGESPGVRGYAAARLAELAEERAGGLIAPEQADAEEAALRRILATASAAPAHAATAPGMWPRLALLAVVIAAALALYLPRGRPDLAERFPPPSRTVDAPGPSQAEFARLVDRLEATLASHPDRIDGWRLLARARLDQGHPIQAFAAAKKGLERAGDDPALLEVMGEALVQQAKGRVTPAARLVFEKLAAADPDNPAPRYYAGLTALQAGKPDEAVKIWRALAKRLSADDPRRRRLEREIARVEMMAAVEGGDPQAAIARMVARLRQRLEANPDDADGWAMLARSYEVLGRPREAIAAYERLKALMPEAEQTRIAAHIAALRHQLAGTPAGTPAGAPDQEREPRIR